MASTIRLCLAALLGLSAAVSAADMVFTMENGNEYTLHDDGTWECKGAQCPQELEEDFVVGLSDGRDIVIERTMRWHVKEDGELVGTADIKIDKASAEAVSTSARIDVADQKARKECLRKVARKIVAGAPKREINEKKVLFCLDHQRLLPDTREQRDEKTGWTITATMSLNRRQILDVIDCAEQVVESGADGKEGGGSQ
ncbi:MAG: hypothetical protein GF331_14460 [Chitinivibrionales bacterium]|nr:hypothetical protein [Chitinivibrionales bacterium]